MRNWRILLASALCMVGIEAHQCKQDYCTNFALGAGVVYEGLQVTSKPYADSAGGFIGINAMHYSRIMAYQADLQVGLINAARYAAIHNAQTERANNVGHFIVANYNLGFNLLGRLDSPLLLFISLPIQSHNLNWHANERLLHDAIFIGFKLYGHHAIGSNFFLAYQAGYAYAIDGRYRIGSYSNVSALQGGHQAQLGLSLFLKREVVDFKYDFYTSLRGIYTNLNQSRDIAATPTHYNANERFLILLEFGVQFGL